MVNLWQKMSMNISTNTNMFQSTKVLLKERRQMKIVLCLFQSEMQKGILRPNMNPA